MHPPTLKSLGPFEKRDEPLESDEEFVVCDDCYSMNTLTLKLEIFSHRLISELIGMAAHN